MDEMNEDLCENGNKRKFQDEILNLPVSKHACLTIHDLRKREKSKSKSNDSFSDSATQSAKDSNSFSEDADSVMSVSNEFLQYNLQHSTSSSVNWTANNNNNNNSFNTKTCPDYPSFEEEQEQLDCCEFSSLEYEIKKSEALEELFVSNSNQFILSSGRWNVNQDTEEETGKLTIDKEFEQYFSTLML